MPETQLLIQMAVILAVTGAFAGVLAGLLGVGGGIILVPVFFYVFERLCFGGDDLMQMCLATSLATILVTSLRSVGAHNKRAAVQWVVLRTWGPGIVAGAVAGMLTVSALRTDVLQVIFGLLALSVGLYMALGRDSWRLGTQMPTGLARATLSPLVGFLSVLMGIGGGAFGVSIMSLYGIAIHRAVATAAGFGVLIAVPAVTGFMLLPVDPAQQPPFSIGAVNLAVFGLIISMTLLTAPLGARLAHAMDPKPLKRVFAVFLIVVALNMLRKVWMA
jgi:uncharacterized membrane protein YfcA